MASRSALLLGVVLGTAVLTAAGLPSRDELVQRAKTVLADNWRVNHTVPSAHLYPNSWSWDSAFIAMAYSLYDEERGMREMQSLFAGQWSDGMLPHIVFSRTAQEYFPGPSFWRTNTTHNAPAWPRTSGIVQPPVHPMAVWELYQRATNRTAAQAFVEEMYPKLRAWIGFLYRERADSDNSGLVFIVHPWESGMDNSVAWDEPLQRVNISADGGVPPYNRSDTHSPGVDPRDRPTKWAYDRFVYLVAELYRCSYDVACIRDRAPFRVLDPTFNAILSRAAAVMAQLAPVAGRAQDVAPFRTLSERTARAMEARLWSEEAGMFLAYDERAQAHAPRQAVSGVAAVFADLNATVTARLAATIDRADFCGPLARPRCYGLPSLSLSDANFSTHNYWQGPVWVNINWLAVSGLERAGYPRQAARLRDNVYEIMQRTGFYEYFNPFTAAPHGAGNFSWSAALYIHLVHTDPRFHAHASGWAAWQYLLLCLGAALFVVGGIVLLRAHARARARRQRMAAETEVGGYVRQLDSA